DATGTLTQTAFGVDVMVIDTDADITGLPTPGTLTAGWYVVTGNFTHAGTITVTGNVNLILADGGSLTINGSTNNAGINVTGSNSLTIYAQSAGAAMGSLTATGGSMGAGIGGGDGGEGDSITITGSANVTAIGGSSNSAGGGAGIGSGGSLTTAPISAGSITIAIDAAGTLAATGGAGTTFVYGGGANIGQGGHAGGDGVALTLYTVTATAGANGSISPFGTYQTAGTSSMFTITPGSGYAIASVTDNGTDVTGLLAGNTHVHRGQHRGQPRHRGDVWIEG
ncbi:MAG: hypothetical protein LBB65_01080, partial [Burkholderiales bacterium]|nr:hypothetical protein [Burkholderiales bacterium]